MNVERWMTRTVHTCQPTDTLQTAAQLLWQHDLGSLPVVDADRRVLGVVTDRDLCMAAFTRGSTLAHHTVGSAMARQVTTIGPRDSIRRAHELLRGQQLRRLPVVDAENRLVGVITIQDLVLRSMTELPSTKRKSAASEILQTLGAIASPRVAQAIVEITLLDPIATIAPPRASRKRTQPSTGARSTSGGARTRSKGATARASGARAKKGSRRTLVGARG